MTWNLKKADLETLFSYLGIHHLTDNYGDSALYLGSSGRGCGRRTLYALGVHTCSFHWELGSCEKGRAWKPFTRQKAPYFTHAQQIWAQYTQTFFSTRSGSKVVPWDKAQRRSLFLPI